MSPGRTFDNLLNNVPLFTLVTNGKNPFLSLIPCNMSFHTEICSRWFR